LSKLKKLQLANEFADMQDEKFIVINSSISKKKTTSNHEIIAKAVEEESTLQKRALYPVKDSRSPGDNLAVNHSDGSSIYEDGEYRVRRFPATNIPDYPGGIPIYRRRSLHPALSDPLPDPYEEIILRSPRELAKLDARRIISRVMEGSFYANENSYKSQFNKRPTTSKATSWRLLLNAVIYLCSGLLYLLLSPLNAVRFGKSRLSFPSCRILSLFFCVCCLAGMTVFLFYADPFYHNPVNDFAAHVVEP